VLGLQPGSAGTYVLRAGVLRAAQLVIGAAGTGTLRLAPAADVVLTDKLAIGADGRIPADSEGTVRLAGGALANLSTIPANLPGLAGLTVLAEGGEAVTLVEVAGEDRGAAEAGWEENFALATLQVGGDRPGSVRLVNETTNQPAPARGEALYVDTLGLRPGAWVGGQGLALYYRNGGPPKRFFHGDANLDGVVGVADLAALAGSYGLREGASWGPGGFQRGREGRHRRPDRPGGHVRVAYRRRRVHPRANGLHRDPGGGGGRAALPERTEKLTSGLGLPVRHRAEGRVCQDRVALGRGRSGAPDKPALLGPLSGLCP